jgi:transcriptional regulator with XRE-family HTH domain
VASDPQKLLGEAIRTRRLELKLTQEELAEKADLHWTFVSGVERGQRNISILNLYHIASALKVRVRDLIRF